jgi:tetratricopeptide (TPR) repeat protein
MKHLTIGVLIFLHTFAYCQLLPGDTLDSRIEKASTLEEKVTMLNSASAALTDADLKRSFDYATRAQTLATQSHNDTGLVAALLNLGKCNTRLGREETAMQNFLHALEISEKIGDEKLVGLTYKLIGNSYYFNNESSLALEFYQRALRINEKTKDEETAADLQNNIALVYISTNKLDSALLNLLKSAATYERLNKPRKLANSLLNMGEVKDLSKLPIEAIEYYQKAQTINQSNGLKLQEGYALNNIAKSLVHIQKYTEAEQYCVKALNIALKEKFKPLLVNVYNNLYTLNKENKKFTVALLYHEKLLDLKDSLFDVQKNKQMEELRTKYESEQKERENQSLLLETGLKGKQLSVTRTLLFSLAVFACIVTILAFIYFKSLVKNRKANRELLELNKRIKDQNDEISEQAEELNQMNHEIAAINENLETLVKEKTRKILEQNQKLLEYTSHNAHQVRGPLARILGLINLINMGMVKPEEMEFTLKEISKASDELDSVIQEINEILQEGK